MTTDLQIRVFRIIIISLVNRASPCILVAFSLVMKEEYHHVANYKQIYSLAAPYLQRSFTTNTYTLFCECTSR